MQNLPWIQMFWTWLTQSRLCLCRCVCERAFRGSSCTLSRCSGCIRAGLWGQQRAHKSDTEMCQRPFWAEGESCLSHRRENEQVSLQRGPHLGSPAWLAPLSSHLQDVLCRIKEQELSDWQGLGEYSAFRLHWLFVGYGSLVAHLSFISLLCYLKKAGVDSGR